jgi:hypothetical protein
VPYRDCSGGTWNWKLFAPNGRSWWQEPGLGVLMPFGVEMVADLDHRCNRQLWIAEGESDALALREHYAAWRDLPVDVIGLPGAGTWRSEWSCHADGYAAVYAFPDGDAAGCRMGHAIAESVPWVIRVVMPPGSDVRSTLQGEGPEALDRCIINAEASAVLLAGMRTCRTLPELEVFLAEVVW